MMMGLKAHFKSTRRPLVHSGATIAPKKAKVDHSRVLTEIESQKNSGSTNEEVSCREAQSEARTQTQFDVRKLEVTGSRPGDNEEEEEDDCSHFTIPSWISTRLFQEIIVPILYGNVDDRKVHQISLDEAEGLRQSFADPRAVGLSKTNSNRNHNLTYGEVVPESIEKEVLPELGDLDEDDVFYDLGSGTGKIPFQVALQTNVGASKGIEYAQIRHDAAEASLKRGASLTRHDVETALNNVSDQYVDSLCGHNRITSNRKGFAEELAKEIRRASNRLHLWRGDFCREDISDATVIFINNAVFEPDLMLSLVAHLAKLPKLRKVVCLRKLCYRHNRRCQYNGNPCCVFGNPLREKKINPTWCRETTLYTYVKQPTMERWFLKSSTPKKIAHNARSSTAKRRLHNSQPKADSDFEPKTIDFSSQEYAAVASQESRAEDPNLTR